MMKRFNNVRLAIPALTTAALAFAFVFFMNVPFASAATTYYVATTGSDSNPCSQTLPCGTIQHAMDQASNGDTINVAAGTYTEALVINKSLTFKGAQASNDARSRSGAETIVKIPTGQTAAFYAQTSNITVDGFTIDGADGTDSAGIMANQNKTVENLHVTNNIIKNNKVGVDATYNDIDGLTVSRNLFDSNNMDGQSDSVYIANVNSGSDITISNNSFKDTDAGTAGAVGVAINIADWHASDGTVYNNVKILNNTSDNDYGFVDISSAKNVTISGNTATNERKTVVTIDRTVDNLTIKNNNFSNSPVGIKLRGSAPTGGDPITNVSVTGNTISNMTTAGVLVLDKAIGDSVVVANNTFSANAANIVNNGSVALLTSTDGGGNTPSGVKAPSSIDTGNGGFAAQKSLLPVIIAGIAGLAIVLLGVLNRRKLAYAVRRVVK